MAHGALAGNEVLELTSFAEKKAWIDDRIKFLSTQSQVDVALPHPPATATVSDADLEAWWTEHDRIEKEVEAYDMGDLARMRAFARDKSKQALSPRDTDLIEITLSTIFAIDKLLHLLRQRRRSLALLRYRIQWESALELAWSRYKRIVEVDLPTLLGYIRNAGPADPLVVELASSLSRSISLSASTSSRSLAASASSRDLAASGGSSRNRDQLITLARATLETDVRALTSSLVPAAAAALDKLINATPTSLPEPFLDEQDRLENAASALSDGLDRFVDDLIRQDTAAETLRAAAVIGDKEGCQLVDDVTAAVRAGGADKAVLQDLMTRLDSLDERIDGIQADLRQIPRPRHSAVPCQPDASAELIAQLTDLVDMAATTRASAQEAVRLYALRVEVTSEVSAALEDIRTRAARLRGFLAVQEVLQTGDAGSEGQERGRVPLREAGSPPVAAGHSTLDVAEDIDAATRSSTTVIRLVNRARDAGVAGELVRTLKQASAGLAAQGLLAISALDNEKIRRDEMHHREERARALRRVDQRMIDASAKLKAELESALWTCGAPAEAEHNWSRTPFPLPDVEVLLPATSPNFPDGDSEPGAAARAALDRLKEQRDVVERARSQSAAIDEVLRELGAIRSDFHAAAASDRGSLQQLHRGFASLRDSLHTRVPFLSGAPAVSSFPDVDFEAHDTRVREHLNEVIAVLAAIFAQRSADVETRIASKTASTSSEPPCLDIFSPTFEPSSTDLPVATRGAEYTLDLLERLDAFTSTRWLAHGAVQLPQFADIHALDEELQTCRATFDSTYTSITSEAFQWVDVVEMRQRLESAGTTVARLRDLAAFAGVLSLTDATLSDLLIHIDDTNAVATSSADADSEPSDIIASTVRAVGALRIASKPCADDRRVRIALRRVEMTYESLLAMLSKPARSTSSLSTQSSRSSHSVHQTERPTSAAVSQRATSPPVNESDRARIGRTPKRLGPPNVAQRSPPYGVPRTPRASHPLKFSSASTTVTPFSFDTPGHHAAKHLARSEARTPAKRLFQDMARNRRTQPDHTPRHEREHRSTSHSKQTLSPRPARKSSTLTPLAASKGPRQSLRHARANTLQAAVSAVMQQLPFVSIEIAEGRFTEESGVYLIGGRTCFLRLLASKQVMVRVGGGWLELSQFIVTHFSKDDILTVSPSRKHLSHSAGQSPGSQRLGLSLSASLRSIDEYLTTVEISPARLTSASDSSPTATRRSVARSSSDADLEPETGASRGSALARPLDDRKLRPKLPVWRP